MKGTIKNIILSEYKSLLDDLKAKIKHAQIKAVLSVNQELIKLYWDIGKAISEKQEHANWGNSVVEKIAKDIKKEFSLLKGFSRSNIFSMQQFFKAYRNEDEIVQQLVGQIPWGHNLLLLSKVKKIEERKWYINKTIENGWSRSVLEHQIETNLYTRLDQKKRTDNFEITCLSKQADLLKQTIKDPYIFDFLTLEQSAKEKDLQKALTEKIKNFLLELGSGFAFMGTEYHLKVDGNDFYIDMLFYHHRLRCLFAIELKMEDFKPEFAGKMNFYLTALDEIVKHKEDNPSVGLILCRGKNKTIVEYSLRDIQKPIGISEYKLTKQLKKDYRLNLPSTDTLEKLIEAN